MRLLRYVSKLNMRKYFTAKHIKKVPGFPLDSLTKECRAKTRKIFKNQELIRLSGGERTPEKTCKMVTRDTTLWGVSCQLKSVKISRFGRGLPFCIRDKGYDLGGVLFLPGSLLPERVLKQ